VDVQHDLRVQLPHKQPRLLLQMVVQVVLVVHQVVVVAEAIQLQLHQLQQWQVQVLPQLIPVVQLLMVQVARAERLELHLQTLLVQVVTQILEMAAAEHQQRVPVVTSTAVRAVPAL
jgi:hypothetical protein